MSGITLTQAQSILDAYVQSLVDDPLGGESSYSLNGRTVTYQGVDDRLKWINYWSRLVASLTRTAAGVSRHGYVLPNFSGRTCR